MEDPPAQPRAARFFITGPDRGCEISRIPPNSMAADLELAFLGRELAFTGFALDLGAFFATWSNYITVGQLSSLE